MTERAADSPNTEVADVVRQIWRSALGLNDVAANDNFFAVGGDSIAAAAIVEGLQRQLNVTVSLKDFYGDAIFGNLVARIRRAEPDDREPDVASTPYVDRRRPLRASIGLEWSFLVAAEHSSQQNIDPFLMQEAMNVRGPIDPARLRRALRLVSERHELLRTTFHPVGDTTYAHVDPAAEIEFRHVPAAGSLARGHIRSETERPFDWRNAPLARSLLFSFSPTNHLLVFVLDHRICDGVSLSIFLRDFKLAYEHADDPSFSLPPVETPFLDWAQAQRERWSGSQRADTLAYWRHRLGPDPDIVSTPFTEYRAPKIRRPEGMSITLTEAETDLVRRASHQRDATLYSLILGGFLAALRGRVRGTDFAVVTTIANRGSGLADTFGPIAHDAYVRVDLAAGRDLDGLVRQVQVATAEAMKYGMVPNTTIIEELWPDAGFELLDKPAFYFSVNRPWAAGFALAGLRVAEVNTSPGMPMPGLECTVNDHGRRLVITLRWLAGSFPRDYFGALRDDLLRFLLTAADVVDE